MMMKPMNTARILTVCAALLAVAAPVPAAEELVEGANAPEFSLDATDGSKVSLSGLAGKNVVLYFYPKDDTPGCTKEAKAFEEARAEFEALNTVILGVSLDSLDSHKAFTEKCDLGFPLLSDTGGAVISAYGCWRTPNMFKGSAFNVNRSTFLIDGAGIVRKIWRSVSVGGHAADVLAEVKKLGPAAPSRPPL